MRNFSMCVNTVQYISIMIQVIIIFFYAYKWLYLFERTQKNPSNTIHEVDMTMADDTPLSWCILLVGKERQYKRREREREFQYLLPVNIKPNQIIPNLKHF